MQTDSFEIFEIEFKINGAYLEYTWNSLIDIEKEKESFEDQKVGARDFADKFCSYFMVRFLYFSDIKMSLMVDDERTVL